MKHVRTRRQLLRVATVSAASIPFLALAIKSASAQNQNQNQNQNNNHPRSCFLKGTKISRTPSGDRVQCRTCKLEMKFRRLPVVRLLSGLDITNSQREKAELGMIT